jgi:hypothetical protein
VEQASITSPDRSPEAGPDDIRECYSTAAMRRILRVQCGVRLLLGGAA